MLGIRTTLVRMRNPSDLRAMHTSYSALIPSIFPAARPLPTLLYCRPDDDSDGGSSGSDSSDAGSAAGNGTGRKTEGELKTENRY